MDHPKDHALFGLGLPGIVESDLFGQIMRRHTTGLGPPVVRARGPAPVWALWGGPAGARVGP